VSFLRGPVARLSYEVGRAQKTQASEDFPAGENRAVREEQDKPDAG
jgi:hypothetical protein